MREHLASIGAKLARLMQPTRVASRNKEKRKDFVTEKCSAAGGNARLGSLCPRRQDFPNTQEPRGSQVVLFLCIWMVRSMYMDVYTYGPVLFHANSSVPRTFQRLLLQAERSPSVLKEEARPVGTDW